MHKHVNLTEKPLLMEYITVNGDIPEILSVMAEKKTFKNYLIIEKPFFVTIVCKNKEDFSKTLALFKID